MPIRGTGRMPMPVKPSSAGIGWLPVGAGRFVGRRREVGAVEDLVAGGARVVTITGQPGIGKSRLAWHVATRRGAAPVPWVVEGRSAKAPGAGLARACGLAKGTPLLEGLAKLRWDPGRLLVCEAPRELNDEVRALLATVLAQVPTLRIVAASRRPLRVEGEVVVPLEGLERTEARGLFVDRAAALGLAVGDDAPGVRELVALLDGHPLALEAAAECALTASVFELGVRMGTQPVVQVLSAARDSPARRFEDQWEGLPTEARRALRQASVFEGAFELEAAEAVLHVGGPGATLRALAHLREESLLVVRAPTEPRGTTQYVLPPLVRDFARWKLAQADPIERDGVRARAREQAVGRALRAGGRSVASTLLQISGEAKSAETLEDPLLRSLASQLATAGSDTRGGLRLAESRALRELARFGDARRSAGLALRHARRGHDRGLEARALREHGRIAMTEGRPEHARARLEAALEGFRALGDRAREAHVLALLADVAQTLRQTDDARRFGERAVRLLRELGGPEHEAHARYCLGALCCWEARRAEAVEHWEAARVGAAGQENPVLAALAAGNAALVAWDGGQRGVAVLRLEEARQIFRTCGRRRPACVTLGYTAMVLHEEGRLVEAVTRYAAAVEGLGESGESAHASLFRAGLAVALATLGRAREAEAALAAATTRLGAYGEVVEVCCATVALIGRQGPDPEAAARAMLERAPADSDDLRFARRLLEAALRDASAREAREAPGWRISRDGQVGLPSGLTLDLPPQGALRGILVALAEERLARPGVPVTPARLVLAGWPSEQLIPRAAKNRLNVALSTLRKLGLRPLLVRTPGGYYLSPLVPLELEGARSAAISPRRPGPGA